MVKKTAKKAAPRPKVKAIKRPGKKR